MPVAPVSTIAVWFGVRRGFGVLCGVGEGMGVGMVAGGLQRFAVEIMLLLPNLVLVFFITTAMSVPPRQVQERQPTGLLPLLLSSSKQSAGKW